MSEIDCPECYAVMTEYDPAEYDLDLEEALDDLDDWHELGHPLMPPPLEGEDGS